MGHHLTDAISLLFPEQGSRVGNIKFFRGTTREVTAEQLAEQYVLAERQIRDGVVQAVVDIDGNLDD